MRKFNVRWWYTDTWKGCKPVQIWAAYPPLSAILPDFSFSGKNNIKDWYIARPKPMMSFHDRWLHDFDAVCLKMMSTANDHLN